MEYQVEKQCGSVETVCIHVYTKKRMAVTTDIQSMALFGSQSPALDATKSAAWLAFCEYVRCGASTVLPPAQMLSPWWQMI